MIDLPQVLSFMKESGGLFVPHYSPFRCLQL